MADYLTNFDVITDSFIPGLHDSFGVCGRWSWSP